MFLKPFTKFLYDHYKKKKVINNMKIQKYIYFTNIQLMLEQHRFETAQVHLHSNVFQ